MPQSKQCPNYFVVHAFDHDLWCPVLEAIFEVRDLEKLRAVLGSQAEDDADFRNGYDLDSRELEAVNEAFNIQFDPAPLQRDKISISLYRLHSIREAPYLIHTGFELFLLLDGRKKLARMADSYPPTTFEGEDRFDHWVRQGVLAKEEVIEPFDHPRKKWLGIRTVHYTLRGEEWRIPAMEMLWKAASRSGGWNEHFERLQGMLFGYDDEQNDWWIEHGIQKGGFGGARLCCAVDAEGLAWIEAAGFRALSPIKTSYLSVIHYDINADAQMREFMTSDEGNVALICFNIFSQEIDEFINLERDTSWQVPRDKIPLLNQNLRRLVQVVARRDCLRNHPQSDKDEK